MSLKTIKIPTSDAAAPRVSGSNGKRPRMIDVFNKILIEKGIDDMKLSELILAHIKKEDPEDTEAIQMRSAEHWLNHLKDNNLSWVKFCKGLEMIGVDELVLSV